MKDFSHHWQPGLSLPQAVYTAPACFDADMARLMREQWLLVDHASRLPNPGDYFLAQIGAESVIVTRNRTGELRAFYNACRHRGSRICLEREGSRRTFTCPYHAWTYDLDGALRSAQHMPEDFDRAQHGLKPVGVGQFEGLIFVNFAEPGQAPDFAAYTDRFAPLLRGQGLARTKIAARKTYPTAANWKLVVENFFECYHCLPAHKTYCSVHDKMKMLAFGAGSGSGVGADIAAYLAKLKDWEASASALGYPVGMWHDDGDGATFQSANRLPVADGALTESLDGKPLAPLMAEFGAFDGGQTGCVFNPMATLLVNNDHAVMFAFFPRSATQTDVETIWLVRDDAVEGQDYDPAALMHVWDTTLMEDKTITENNQLGVLSRAYQPGIYSAQESRIADFGRWYMRQFTA